MLKATVKVEIPVSQESKLAMSDFKFHVEGFINDLNEYVEKRFSSIKFEKVKISVEYDDVERGQLELDFED